MNDLVMRLNAFEELRRRVRIAAGLEDQRRFWMRLDRERGQQPAQSGPDSGPGLSRRDAAGSTAGRGG